MHDRGRVLADIACVIADGARVISDFRVLCDQRELFGLVASVPTAYRTLAEIAAAGHGRPADDRGSERGPAARLGAGGGPAWDAAGGAGRGQDTGGVTRIRLDATVTTAHSDKELAEANFKGLVRRDAARGE